MNLEESYQKEVGSHSGTEVGFTVEARYNFHTPIKIGEQIFDKEWRRFRTQESSEFGVPFPRGRQRLARHNLYGYAQAQAIRWWLHAAVDAEGMASLCLETRIVKHKITFSEKLEAVSAHEFVGGDDRSNILPDWGKE